MNKTTNEKQLPPTFKLPTIEELIEEAKRDSKIRKDEAPIIVPKDLNIKKVIEKSREKGERFKL